MTFYPLSKLHRLVEGLRERHQVAGVDILLLHIDGKTHLIDNLCPHANRPLHNGACNGRQISCPAHGLHFSLSTDLCIEQPKLQLKRYAAVYEGDTLGVEL